MYGGVYLASISLFTWPLPLPLLASLSLSLSVSPHVLEEQPPPQHGHFEEQVPSHVADNVEIPREEREKKNEEKRAG